MHSESSSNEHSLKSINEIKTITIKYIFKSCDINLPDLMCSIYWKRFTTILEDTCPKGNITKYCQVVLSTLLYKQLTARNINASYSVCILADTNL